MSEFPAGEPARLVVVVAHPSPDSFSHALAAAVTSAAAASGAAVTLQDLYGDGFDPRMAASEVGTTTFADPLAARYAREVLGADALAIVHPVWFFHVPAILKGWVERILREGVAYELGSGGEAVGLLRARAALIVNGANSGPEVERALGDPVSGFWERIVFGHGDVAAVRRLRFSKVEGSTAAQREAWLGEAAEAASALVDAL